MPASPSVRRQGSPAGRPARRGRTQTWFRPERLEMKASWLPSGRKAIEGTAKVPPTIKPRASPLPTSQKRATASLPPEARMPPSGPVVGLIDSVAAELVMDRIGVLATPATAASGAYRRAIHASRPSATVHEVGCPRFVPLIEAGDLNTPALREAAQEYLAPLLEARVEAIVLGCTHYPLLRSLLAELVPPEVQLVDPAVATAQRLGPLLASLGDLPEVEIPSEPDSPPLDRSQICVTGPADAFAEAATAWLGTRPTVRTVSLHSPARAF